MNATLALTPLGAALLSFTETGIDGPAGSAVVALDGGVRAWVDPLDPSGISLLQVSAADEVTEAVVAAFIGTTAATRVMDLLSAAEDDEHTSPPHQRVELVIEWGSAALDVARLGFLLWLEQNSIWALDTRVLDLEIGVVAARLDMLGTGELAERRLNSGLTRLLELTGVETGVAPPPMGMSDVLSEALETIGSSYSEGFSEDFVARLENSAQSLRNLEGTGSFMGALDENLMDRVAHAGRARDFALVAGLSDGLAVAEGSYSVDWRQVPRNVLDCSEDTVRAVWRGPDDPTLEVKVRALDSTDRNAVISRSLMFRAVLGDNDEPVAAGELDFDQQAGAYRGKCYFDRDLSGVHVDVFSVMSVLPAATGALRSRRNAARHAATALQYERVPGVDPHTAAAAAVPLWREAASRFRDADSTAGKGTEDAKRAKVADARAGMLEEVSTRAVKETSWIATLPKVTLAEALWFDGLRSLTT